MHVYVYVYVYMYMCMHTHMYKLDERWGAGVEYHFQEI